MQVLQVVEPTLALAAVQVPPVPVRCRIEGAARRQVEVQRHRAVERLDGAAGLALGRGDVPAGVPLGLLVVIAVGHERGHLQAHGR